MTTDQQQYDKSHEHKWRVVDTTIAEGEPAWVRVECVGCGYRDAFAEDPGSVDLAAIYAAAPDVKIVDETHVMTDEFLRATMGDKWNPQPWQVDTMARNVEDAARAAGGRIVGWTNATPTGEWERFPGRIQPVGDDEDVVARADDFAAAFAQPGNAWRAEARALIIELAAEVKRLRETRA